MIEDIQTLNEWSLEGRLEVTAMSAATYPLVQDRYVLLPHGASIGSGYGPVVVARERLSLDELRDIEIVIPGELTTAFLVLKMALGCDVAHRVLSFEEILPEVAAGRARAGLLIHEGQLTYRDEGLEKCLDLGEWWLFETGLPLQLGVNTARRDIGEKALREVSAICGSRSTRLSSIAARRSSSRSFRSRNGCLGGDAFVGMYVNELTLDYGEEGREAIRELLMRSRPDVRLEWVR